MINPLSSLPKRLGARQPHSRSPMSLPTPRVDSIQFSGRGSRKLLLPLAFLAALAGNSPASPVKSHDTPSTSTIQAVSHKTPKVRMAVDVEEILELTKKGEITHAVLLQKLDAIPLYVFELKDGSEIEFYRRESEDPTLMKALKAAGITVEPEKYHFEPRHFGEEILKEHFVPIAIGLILLLLGLRQGMIAKKKWENEFQVEFPDNRLGEFRGYPAITESLAALIRTMNHSSAHEPIKVHHPVATLIRGAAGVGKSIAVKAIAGETRSGLITLHASHLLKKSNGKHEGFFTKLFHGEAEHPFNPGAQAEMFEGMEHPGAYIIERAFQKAAKEAEKHGRCIIYIENFELLAQPPQSHTPQEGLEIERHQACAKLIECLEEKYPGVHVIASTSVEDTSGFNKQLMRDGLFGDHEIVIPIPRTPEDRVAILENAMSKITAHPHVRQEEKLDLNVIAKLTHGMSGATLTKIVEDSARIALERRDNHIVSKADPLIITMTDLDEAYTREVFGHITFRALSTKEKTVAAAHSLGHILVATLADIRVDSMGLHNRQRGGMGHVHVISPNYGDRALWTQEDYLKMALCAVAGQAGEKAIIKKPYADFAAEDLEEARSLLREALRSGLLMGIPERDYSDPKTPLTQADQKKVLSILRALVGTVELLCEGLTTTNMSGLLKACGEAGGLNRTALDHHIRHELQAFTNDASLKALIANFLKNPTQTPKPKKK